MGSLLKFNKLNLDLKALVAESATLGDDSATQDIEDAMAKLEEVSRAIGQPQDGIIPDEELKLADAANHNFDLRIGKVAQLWKAELAGATDEWKLSYTACKGRFEKAGFRKEWAARKLKELQVVRCHSTKFCRVDTRKGEYLNFGMLVESFGVHYDKDKAVRLAVKYAQKALVLGAPWTQHDTMADITEYLKLKTQFKEEFQEAWELREKEFENTELDQAPSTAAPAQQTTQTTPAKRNAEALTTQGQGLTTPAAAKQTQGQGRVPSPPAGKKAKNELSELIFQVSKVKIQYAHVMSQCQNLISTIEAQQAWSWARTPEGLDDLKSLLESVVIPEGCEIFILNDIKDIKTSMTADKLMTLAVLFVQIKPVVEQVEERCNQLLKAHPLMQKAGP